MNKLSIRFGLAIFVLACSLCAQASPKHKLPKLVLFISVDQMRYDYLTRFETLLESGLHTLQKKGTVFSEARYRHSATETGPGHAVLLSGKHPSHSGIIANEWYDRNQGSWVNVVEDSNYQTVGGKGRAASPRNLETDTLGDILKKRNPKAKVVSISGKDRSAILLGGKKPDAAFWVGKHGDFITSTYYMSQLPSWVKENNSRDYVSSFQNKTWDRLLDVNQYVSLAGLDAVSGESLEYGNTFPHKILMGPTRGDQVDSFMHTPFLDNMVIDFALEARKEYRLGEDDITDILALSLSATDKIGHTYGPDSQEMMDQIVRLDRLLGHLFQKLDSSVGLENTLVVLSADHGVLPLVELLLERGVAAQRIHSDIVMHVVQETLARHFPGKDALLLPSEPPAFWLNYDKISSYRLSLSEVKKIVADSLMNMGVFEDVFIGDTLEEGSTGPVKQLFHNSYYPLRSPDIMGYVRANIIVDDNEMGTGHGTAHDYDRHVPIVFMGQGIPTQFSTEECGPEDIAPTLAYFLGLPFEKETDARLLHEVISAGSN